MLQQPSILLPLVGLTLMSLVAGTLAAEPASEPGDTMNAHHIARLKEIREIAIAADGDAIAVVLRAPRQPLVEEDGAAWDELHIVTPDGEQRAFVRRTAVKEIAWRPASDEISFLAKRGDDPHQSLYLISQSGGEARRLATPAGKISAYSWSPDGRQVAVVAEQAESEERNALSKKGFTQKIYEEDWRDKKLWLVTADGSAERRELDLDGTAQGVYWSPRAHHLAVSVSPTPLIDDELMQTRLRVVDSASGEELARIANPGKIGVISWSPDGRHLAIQSAADLRDPREGRLMVVAIADDGSAGELRDLLPGLEAHITQLAWRNASRLVFVVQQGVEARLEEIDLKGGGKTLIADGGPIWEELSVAASGDIALVGSTPEHPREVFYLDTESAAARRLTHSQPWLADLRLARQEPFRFAARDGLDIEGVLIHPLETEPGQRHPLVVIVHGGPEAHVSNGWITSYSRPGQVLAGRGFASFYPNYRASTGRGVAFSKLDHGDAAGKEFDDIVDGVDALVDLGLVDRDRVGITGRSYGGFATAWAATYYSERFAAAVMGVGISERIAKFGTSDIPNELHLVHGDPWPWEAWKFMLERSPIYHVEKARTPILIMHSEDDTRVHPSQSLILYRFLKTLGKVPVRLVLYPDEGHGQTRAASRLDASLRLLRWMEHYLVGPGGEPPPWRLDYDEPAAAGATTPAAGP